MLPVHDVHSGAPVQDGRAPLAGLPRPAQALNKDREFLTRGGVFTDSMIDAYLDLKGQEVQRYRMTTHPIEFDMYYSL